MSALVEPFRAIEGKALRIVATLGSVDYEIRYIRDDVKEQYDDAALDRMYTSFMANQVSADDLRMTASAGSLNAQVFFFERVLTFLFPSSRYESVLVAYDREDSVSVAEIVNAATDLLHTDDLPG